VLRSACIPPPGAGEEARSKPLPRVKELSDPPHLSGHVLLPWGCHRTNSWASLQQSALAEKGLAKEGICKSLLKCCLRLLKPIGKGSPCWYFKGFWTTADNLLVVTARRMRETSDTARWGGMAELCAPLQLPSSSDPKRLSLESANRLWQRG